MRRTRVDEPVLITTAHESAEHEYLRRRRRYAITMSVRTLCVLAAALTYQLSIFLSLAFIVGGVVLPWCAVIVANDRPPRKRVAAPTYRPGMGTERALTAGPHDPDGARREGRTIDG